MWVGEKAKVRELNRPTDEDRSDRVGQEGLVVRRLNVAWTPDTGELWELRFDDGEVVVFSSSELDVVRGVGAEPIDMEDLKESWGDAPRRPSLPFRRFGAGSGAAPAVLALLVFTLAGVLLLWAGVSEASLVLGLLGAVLVLVGIVAAGVLIS
jgi:hypothetical protein